MATSLQSIHSTNLCRSQSFHHKTCTSTATTMVVRLRAQCYHRRNHHKDDGGEDIVEAGLKTLREKIEELRKNEELKNVGWNYKAVNRDDKHKAPTLISEIIALIHCMVAVFGLVFISGSFCIMLVSVIVHIYHE